VEWLLSGGGDAEHTDDADDDDGFGGLSAMASATAERDTEDAETDLSGFGEQDPFGEGVPVVARAGCLCVSAFQLTSLR
jgi:hypothetical protein